MGTSSLSLIAFDTDHIKGYVFRTNPLKEIRGASSLLDYLNRYETVQKALDLGAEYIECIYANGGSALFLVDTEKAELLGRDVQRLYRERTGGGASITYAIQPLPADVGDQDIEQIKQIDMLDTLDLLRLCLRAAKNSPGMPNCPEKERDAPQEKGHAGWLTLPSHPFMALCSSCGALYAAEMLPDQDDPVNAQDLYCRSCWKKRDEDRKVRKGIEERRVPTESLWGRILDVLGKQHYDLSANPQRPKSFNDFPISTQGKGYLGLVYADANGMGKKMEGLKTLQQVEDFAREVDEAVFQAMGHAIAEHLPVQEKKFPFDILLVGGDDIAMVVPAARALQVAHTLAEQFQVLTEDAMKKYNLEKIINKCTLSVGVVLTPVKYPFYLQQVLADDTLKAAKKAGSSDSEQQGKQAEETRVNFVVLTGSTSLSYEKIDQEMHRKKLPGGNKDEFYATLRPYTLAGLTGLLHDLKVGNQMRLGRTKLHQLREAILRMNRTTTILEALALLRNWRPAERKFIEDMVDQHDTRTIQQKRTETLFPWYRESQPDDEARSDGEPRINGKPGSDGKSTSDKEAVYRTPLLDFIELYDFVAQEERSSRS